mgnify:CR=1 FL=1
MAPTGICEFAKREKIQRVNKNNKQKNNYNDISEVRNVVSMSLCGARVLGLCNRNGGLAIGRGASSNARTEFMYSLDFLPRTCRLAQESRA